MLPRLAMLRNYTTHRLEVRFGKGRGPRVADLEHRAGPRAWGDLDPDRRAARHLEGADVPGPAPFRDDHLFFLH